MKTTTLLQGAPPFLFLSPFTTRIRPIAIRFRPAVQTMSRTFIVPIEKEHYHERSKRNHP